MPVFSPRRASVRTWSSVSRTSASMPPRWIVPTSWVNELLMFSLDDMRQSSCVRRVGFARWVLSGAPALRLGLAPERFGRDSCETPVFRGHVVYPDAHVFLRRTDGLDQGLGD